MKKKICVFALPTVMFMLPSLSFASPKPVDFSRQAGIEGFFSSIQYKYAVPYFGAFSLVHGGKPLDVFSAKDAESSGGIAAAVQAIVSASTSDAKGFQGKYNPSYLHSKQALSASAGYSTGYVRVEVEGMHQKFLIDPKRYKARDNAYRFAASVSSSETGKPTAANPKKEYYISLENRDLIITSLVANLCYDMIPEESRLSPNICVGAGIGYVKAFGVLEQRWAYQTKVGMQYFLSRKASVFFSVYADKVDGEKFKNVRVKHNIAAPSSSGGGSGSSSANQSISTDSILYPDANLSLLYYGLECGVRLTL
ncbi:P44/Msp2 family outer membrane protein [Anaplasma phagocytophilum str. Norway variant1]|uniref:P44/Msp2 family outer membrane protein n=1 Tax=Anaplasma phagocytophilum str. Norway variant1 TaxID=1392506 RepID=A0A7H9DZY1_ANAPH|nr:P44/Msp2 family outer membrane protein [Anaplasma phagocytophilum]QLL67103.1 P44/Msp2 family outer membrane protein [Anaplasma phagocytophilum str. Norway variant1]